VTVPMLSEPIPSRIRVRVRIACAIGLLGAIAAIRLPAWATLRIARTARTLCPRRPTTTQANQLVAGVQWASKYWPGRSACLESSLGAFLAGVLLLRAAPDWCVVGCFRPIQVHAWIEVDGQPLGQTEAIAQHRFQPFLRV
jgi:hypothetical protein